MTQYRHEYKYYISYFDYLVLKQRLMCVLERDLHAGPSGEYLIRSLYFDTPRDKALHEKEDGLSRRDKFRIRCYNGDYDFIRLEKKVKVSGLGTKVSEKVSRKEVEKIIAKDICWMAEDERELIRELYVGMRYEGLSPKTLVDYVREPFIYEAGNVRITLDREIRSGNNSTDFFNNDIATVPASEGTIILEVKYDNFLPEVVRDIVQLGNRQIGAFSKYAACRRYTRLD